jgi:hypothetical protein
MALDWIAGHRPKPGHEAEFQEIVETLLFDRLGRADRAAASRAQRERRAFFGRPKTVQATGETLRRRYDEIGIPASETLSKAAAEAPGIPGIGDGAPEWPAERALFHAGCLAGATAIIGDHLLQACHEVKFAPDLSAFGRALLVRANAFAKARQLDMPGMPPADPASPEGQLHAVATAGRWCRFWGERGHLLEPSS